MAKKITDDQVKMAEELAAMGLSVKNIAEAVGLHPDTLSRKNRINQAIQKGRQKARQQVAQALMERAQADPGATAAIYLAKRLKVYDGYVPTSTPKTPEEALERIGVLYEKAASGEVEEDRALKLVSIIESWLKGHEVVEQGKKIKELEKLLEADRGEV